MDTDLYKVHGRTGSRLTRHNVNIGPQDCKPSRVRQKVKGKGHPRTDHEGPVGSRGVDLLFL